MTTLQTDRLTLRPMTEADAEAHAAIRFHPKVARWLLPIPADPLTAARAAIERYALNWRERGYGPWGLFHEGRLIGHAGLHFVVEFGETEVLWTLHPVAWRQGFASEAARASLDYGFDVLGKNLIFAMTKPDNRASQAVMKRLGLVYRKDVVYRGIDSVWFEIDRATWLASAGQKHL